ncbi:hypothetical protein, partial [uncultured Cyclobacterium sp.]|uniref:hypothetical protein n=1 Tax=uncultured Cyclobacterium sp. TaxID=453820 RepID=UPI0030EC1CB0
RIEGCSCKPTPSSRRHKLHLGGIMNKYNNFKERKVKALKCHRKVTVFIQTFFNIMDGDTI